MEARDIRAFVERDWQRVAAAKTAHWRDQKVGRSATQILAAGEALRRHARVMRPEWPSARERADDVAVHLRVSEALRAVGRRSR
jgi:hypothetical protein